MTGFFSFLSDKGYIWIIKLLTIAILLALWNQYVSPYISGIQAIGICYINSTLYTVLSYQVVNFMAQIMVLELSWKILQWILPHHNAATTSIDHG